jgi:hypothetical protein
MFLHRVQVTECQNSGYEFALFFKKEDMKKIWSLLQKVKIWKSVVNKDILFK